MMLLGKGGKALCIDATITPRFSTLLNPDCLLARHKNAESTPKETIGRPRKYNGLSLEQLHA